MTFSKEKIAKFPKNVFLSRLVTITKKCKAMGKSSKKALGEGWDYAELVTTYTCNQCDGGAPASR